MSIINLFLQKRKMHESQHGIIMVITAYALSVMMLILGSDVFYNINSAAAGISTTNEETQEKINGELSDLQTAELTTLLIQSKQQNPFGIAEITETGLGSVQAQRIAPGTAPTVGSNANDMIWLHENTMNQEEYAKLIEQMPDFTSISTVVPTADLAVATAVEDTLVEDEIYSMSTEEAVSPYIIDVTEEEIEMLHRIVQAEAGGEDRVGKILIVNVILNRIEDNDFPDTVEEVIFQNKKGEYQFSPVDDKSYWSVDISEDTEEAVLSALEGEDHSEGALYFIARKRTRASSAEWFDNNLKWLFKHGGHEFYR